MNRFVAYDVAPAPLLDSDIGKRSGLRRLAFLATACGLFSAAGFLIGSLIGIPRAAEFNQTRGACIALEFAETFGIVGATQKRQAMHAMSTSIGRHDGVFPKSVTEFEDLCIRTWTSDRTLGR